MRNPFKTKVRYYDDIQRHTEQVLAVRVWKLFGFVVWRRREPSLDRHPSEVV